MNRKQKICLWIGIIVFTLMGLFPPAQERVFDERYGDLYYRFVLNAIDPVILRNLLVQWIVVSVITGSLIYTFRDKKPKDKKDNK